MSVETLQDIKHAAQPGLDAVRRMEREYAQTINRSKTVYPDKRMDVWQNMLTLISLLRRTIDQANALINLLDESKG